MTENRYRPEREDGSFHARAAEGYRELATRFPGRVVVLDAALPPAELAERIHGAFLSHS